MFIKDRICLVREFCMKKCISPTPSQKLLNTPLRPCPWSRLTSISHSPGVRWFTIFSTLYLCIWIKLRRRGKYNKSETVFSFPTEIPVILVEYRVYTNFGFLVSSRVRNDPWRTATIIWVRPNSARVRWPSVRTVSDTHVIKMLSRSVLIRVYLNIRTIIHQRIRFRCNLCDR